MRMVHPPAAPARIPGLADRGHLSAVARADIAVHHDLPDSEQMLQTPMLVFKGGEVIVEEGKVTHPVRGMTQVVRPDYDPGIPSARRRGEELCWT